VVTTLPSPNINYIPESFAGLIGIYPNYFNLHVSELSTDVRARH